MKVLWFDSETGGLKAKVNPILTLAGIIEVGGKVMEEFYFKIKPFPGQIVEDGALKVNGITREEIATFEEPRVVHSKLNTLFSKYCNKFDRNDKFVPGGHNVGFDIEQLIAFYELAGDKYLFSWLDYHKMDTMTLSLMLKKKGWINVPNVKLETMCQFYGIQIKAHNAQEDIRATKTLWETIESRLSYKP